MVDDVLEPAGAPGPWCKHAIGKPLGELVTLREANSGSVRAFETALPGIPEIIQAQRLFGDPDYMLHVVARDLAVFQKLYDERLSALPSVLRLTSKLVMKTVLQDRPLAI